MDPGFLFSLTAVSQSNQAARAIGTQARNEAEQRAYLEKILSDKRVIIAQLRQKAALLKPMVYTDPDKVFIWTCIMLQTLCDYAIQPDDFEDEVEKEGLILLVSRIENLGESARRLLSPDQVVACQSWQEALERYRFICLVAARVTALSSYSALTQECEARKRQEKHYSRLQARWIAGTWAASAAVYLGLRFLLGPGPMPTIAIFLAVGIMLTVLFSYGGYEQKKPKDLARLEWEALHEKHAAELDNQGFWDMVRGMYGGIPNLDRLNREAAALKPVFDEFIVEEGEEEE